MFSILSDEKSRLTFKGDFLGKTFTTFAIQKINMAVSKCLTSTGLKKFISDKFEVVNDSVYLLKEIT
jgi:hypothetical protein